MSEIPARASESEDPSDGARGGSAGAYSADTSAVRAATAAGFGGLMDGADGAEGEAAFGDTLWQSSPPGSIYDYIRVASFSIGPDGLVDQWSLRAEQIFGIPADRAVGMDPIEAFIDPDLRERGQRKMAEILDGREWTGVVPFRLPDPVPGGGRGEQGLAEVYVMPTRSIDGEKAAVCIVV
ncbi:PAS domain S-box protein, partial [Streptomyces sp. NPDC002920]